MSKRSTVTVREQPVASRSSATGAFRVHGESFVVNTESRVHIVDLTPQVMALVRQIGITEGIVHLFSMHTTCTVFINEFQQALLADIHDFLERLVARDAAWHHNDPQQSDCDRLNADSHLRAMVLGHELTLQVSGGEVVLGQWQRILMAELDGPRARTFRVQVLGTST
jgi:secondary thiamine-phosphate synthase enzyme